MSDLKPEPTIEHMLACAERSRLLAPIFDHAMAMCKLPTATLEDFKWFGELNAMALGEIPMLDFKKTEHGITWTKP